MKILKATIEKTKFSNLIGKEITFANSIINNSGIICHEKGDKAIISEVEYKDGYYSHLCPDIWIKARISAFKINGKISTCWQPDTFIEFPTIESIQYE